MVGDGTVDSTASTVPNGAVKPSSQNTSMPNDNVKPSAGTPGAASMSSIFNPNASEQSSYDALPSSPESSMEEPLLNTDLVSVRAAAETANS